MFGFGKKAALLAPMTGRSILVTETPDPVFADKILGDGVAVQPTDGAVYSPCDGAVVQVANTLHSVAITSDDGLDVLVHCGINTVDLKGEGFTVLVKEGDKVTAGQKIMTMDLALVEARGLSAASPCIITNMDALKDYAFETGAVTGGKSPVVTYKVK